MRHAAANLHGECDAELGPLKYIGNKARWKLYLGWATMLLIFNDHRAGGKCLSTCMQSPVKLIRELTCRHLAQEWRPRAVFAALPAWHLCAAASAFHQALLLQIE